jgi:secretion/DNA translocation related CpaE-like protein
MTAMSATAGATFTVVTSDAALAATVHRLAELAGATASVLPAGAVRSAWRGSGPLLVDVTAGLEGLERRPHVALVAKTDAELAAWRQALEVGAERLLCLPRDERATLDWMTTVLMPGPAGRVLCCQPGRGGAGASLLAAGIALGAGHDTPTLLIDLDPAAGGLDVLLGCEGSAGVRWPDLGDCTGPLDPATLSDAFVRVGDVSLLSARGCDGPPGDRVTAVETVLTAAVRCFPLVVVDLAPGRSETIVAALARAEHAVIVVPADVRAVTAATGAVQACQDVGTAASVVVRHPAPGDLRPHDVAAVTRAPLTAEWPWDRRLAAVIDAGRFVSGWRRSTLAPVVQRVLSDYVADVAA